MTEQEKHFNLIGEKGTIERLDAIGRANLGERSDAAYRACDKRWRRIELMEMGLSFQDACLIVNKENE